MTTSVTYPPKAAPALGHLTSHNNDVEIFVEDSGTPNLWVKLLQHYLPPNVTLNNVIVLGSKENVIRACKADQASDGRKKLYIIDGDLDVLKRLPKPQLKHLYRLRSYCVENYLLDEDAFVSAARTLNPKIDQHTARQDLDFQGWFERNGTVLQTLFVCYAVTHEIGNEQQTVGFGAFRLLKGDGAGIDFCEATVFKRVIGLYRTILRKHPKDQIRPVFEKIKKNANELEVRRFASGKDYIFPSLYRLIKSKYGANMAMDVFKVLIAQCIDRATDRYLFHRLRKLCG